MEVTAADGATMQTYTVTVTRLVEVWSTTVTAGSNNLGSGFIAAGTQFGTGSMTDDDERFTYLGVEYRVWMVGYATRCRTDCHKLQQAGHLPGPHHPRRRPPELGADHGRDRLRLRGHAGEPPS